MSAVSLVMFVEFNSWKTQEEKATMTRFVKVRGDCPTRVKYYCHRSGRYVAKGRRLRQMKVQGTSKIGSSCPAAIFVKMSAAGTNNCCILIQYK